MDKKRNLFNLSFDFPIIGERQIALSLDPQIVNRTIKNSELTLLLRENLGERQDSAKIKKALEEFFVFLSEFLKFKTSNVFPKHYNASQKDGHFFLERQTNSYRFLIDSFQSNEKFYERFQVKLFAKDLSSEAIVTLFLVPQICEK